MTDAIHNFLVPASSDEELHKLSMLDVDNDWQQFNDGVYCWGLQTYLMLHRHGLRVSCSIRPRAGMINIGHQAYIESLGPQRGIFLVCCRAECRRLPWAQFHIVQNQRQLSGNNSRWMPLWPQPGLVPRDKARRGVASVAYAGWHSTFGGSGEEWNAKLSALGLCFRILDERRWNDLSQVDILLATRSFIRKGYDMKPPTKLINAWIARIPAVAGCDSAYEQVGKPGRDYIRVCSEEEAIGAIAMLRDNSRVYESIVDAGRVRAEPYMRDAVIRRWEDCLDNVGIVFDKWRRRGGGGGAMWDVAVGRYEVATRLRRLAKRLFAGIRNGRRRIMGCTGRKSEEGSLVS